jgi:hypothetical protein
MKEMTLKLRRFPYPYRAMLAICSDLDETPNRQIYWEIMRYLNTDKMTSMGPGISLEVGNSIYFDMPQSQFAYWNTDPAGRDMIRSLIHTGHIDAIHSFGDLAENRSDAARSLDELDRHNCKIKTWIDHGIAPTNFGSDIMRGCGDIPDHQAYHADLSAQYGIRYIWRGRVTSNIGQNTTASYRDLFQFDHPAQSGRTIAKEFVKHVLGRLGYSKYRLNALNDVMTQISLRDGRKMFEFLRSNPCWQSVSASATAQGLGNVLTDSFLTDLIRRQGFCILYTHLGKIKNPHQPFSPKTQSALARLAQYAHTGRILVTTTSRLLDYVLASHNISIAATFSNTKPTINLIRHDIPDHNIRSCDIPLDGISINIPTDIQCDLLIDGKPIACDRHRSVDLTTLSIPWPKLKFPETRKDWS